MRCASTIMRFIKIHYFVRETTNSLKKANDYKSISYDHSNLFREHKTLMNRVKSIGNKLNQKITFFLIAFIQNLNTMLTWLCHIINHMLSKHWWIYTNFNLHTNMCIVHTVDNKNMLAWKICPHTYHVSHTNIQIARWTNKKSYSFM